MNDLVTVIVPCYNQGRFLRDAVASIQEQTHTNWECLIINDGSNDCTAEVANELAESDTRIRHIDQPNQGRSIARNNGLDLSSGDYIQFLDADDYIDRRKFELQLAAMSSLEGIAVSYTNFRCYSDSEEVKVPEFYSDPHLSESNPLLDLAEHFGYGLCIPLHSFLFDARIFSDHGVRFDPELRASEDFACWLRVFELEPAVARVDERLAVYRWHAASTTQNPRATQGDFELAVRKAVVHFRENKRIARALARRIDVTPEYILGEMGAAGRLATEAKLVALRVARSIVPVRARRAIKAVMGTRSRLKPS